MVNVLVPLCAVCIGMAMMAPAARAAAALAPARLRCENLTDPQGIEADRPRLSWIVESAQRGQRQTAWRVLVASSRDALVHDRADLWDSGKVAGDSTSNAYSGKPLVSGARGFWKVKVWDKEGVESDWSAVAQWSVPLLKPTDWSAQWISQRDASPVHADRNVLQLPPARHYRKNFFARNSIARATVYASALGIYELHLNGHRVGDALFAPGWSDYVQRAYYNTYDVTSLLTSGDNAIGAIVADGWYAGYVGYGLLVGYGPNKAGRNFYGKTPAFLAQLEIEYADGSRESIVTDPTWKVTDKGPIREADLIMGESFDARNEMPGWSNAGFDDAAWENAIPAEKNGSSKAIFTDTQGDREVELGFQKPLRMQAYPAPPVRPTQEIKALSMTEQKPGVYIFDLGQNFAGVVRLHVKAPAGTRVQIRYGEMLYPDGRLMTDNLRRARATDFYTCRGDGAGETWSPSFTYHGFRYVEVSGLPDKPANDAITGVVFGSDTRLVSAFECADPMANRLFKNIVWTQRANFVEIPTDCPQRDERLGWMGDAQIYAGAATFNADVQAFFSKWMDDVQEAQRTFGAYPDYAPYPMSHGEPHKSFGAAWTDAGIICPWTIWRAYGDTNIIRRHYDSMTRFMDFRIAASPDNTGVSIGNAWGDWLNLNENTPIQYIDHCYFANSASKMADMAQAIGRDADARRYKKLFDDIKASFNKQYVQPDGSLKVQTQTAHVLAIAFDLLPADRVKQNADQLASMIEKNNFRMATGFLGTKPLLPVLSATGHHDLAVRLFQSRQFPSWGYEVENGATTVWERWDSYTKEHGFDGITGKNNAAMNSFSHYAFGAVCEWMFRSLAGIDSDGPGFRKIVLRPGPPAPGSNPDQKPIDWVNAEYDSVNGRIVSQWKRDGDRFDLTAAIPANTTATVYLPAKDAASITESGKALAQAEGVRVVGTEGDRVVLHIASGRYTFSSNMH